MTRRKYSVSPDECQAVAIGEANAIGVVSREHAARPRAPDRRSDEGRSESAAVASRACANIMLPGRDRLVGVDAHAHPGAGGRVDIAAVRFVSRRQVGERRILVAQIDARYAGARRAPSPSSPSSAFEPGSDPVSKRSVDGVEREEKPGAVRRHLHGARLRLWTGLDSQPRREACQGASARHAPTRVLSAAAPSERGRRRAGPRT